MNALHFSMSNYDLRTNLLPRINSKYAEQWEVAEYVYAPLRTALLDMLNAKYPEGITADFDNDDAYDAQCDAAISDVTSFAKSYFVRKFGKRMTAKYGGKTLDGATFEQGQEIIYWSNSVDKSVILA